MLDTTLRNLVDAIKNRTFKSKQACFDYYLDDLLQAKKFYLWADIAAFINAETDETLSTDTYKFMLKRAKNRMKSAGKVKLENAKQIAQIATIRTPSNTESDIEESRPRIKNPFDLKQSRNRKIDLEEYQNLKNSDGEEK